MIRILTAEREMSDCGSGMPEGEEGMRDRREKRVKG
jgi:hypothetical protein